MGAAEDKAYNRWPQAVADMAKVAEAGQAQAKPRAYSDFPGHVLVRIGCNEHGMDLAVAIRLRRDLDAAINAAAGSD